MKNNECDAYNESRSKSQAYGREFTILKLQGPNGPIFAIFPAENNTYNSSEIAHGTHPQKSWGQGFSDVFTIVADFNTKVLTVTFNPSSIARTYPIIGSAHTHPNTSAYMPSLQDTNIAASYPNMQFEIWDAARGIYQYNSSGHFSATRGCQ